MKDEATSSGLNRLVSLLRRLAASWWLGAILAGIAIIIVASRWSSIDFGALVSVSPAAQVSAAAVYGAGLLAMAQVPRKSGIKDPAIVSAGLSAQLLKYVPGSVWQGQRLVAVGGHTAVLKFVLGVLSAAGLGLAVSGRLLAVVLGSVVAAAAVIVCRNAWGWAEASRIIAWSMAATLSVFASGALVGWGAGLELSWSGREMVGAWGLGVIAIPVPAGLGIRELFLSLSDSAEAAAQLGVVHRIVTLVTDAVVGAFGLFWAMRSR